MPATPLKQKPASLQPTIVKYTQSSRNAIQSMTLHRQAIGYVLRGKKHLYYGDSCREVNAGDLFFLGVGTHYVDDVPEENRSFEQIVFYYDAPQINRIINYLSITYQLTVRNDHSCPECEGQQDVIYPAWNTVKYFFQSVNQYLKEGFFGDDPAAENIKMTELIYLLIKKKDCCINSRILDGIDTQTAGFEQIIQDHIFKDVSVEELAQKCNKSLTSFKKEFKRQFHEPPHKWFIRQRLMHARLLLISTGKSVSEIGIECNFPNTSHFIKLFKKEFGLTPSTYRHQNDPRRKAEIKLEAE